MPPPRTTARRALRLGASWWAPLLFTLAAVAVTVHVPYDNGPPIRSDGLGYHAWTRAVLDGNLSFCRYPELRRVGALSERQATGRCAAKYPPGLALLRFPIMAWFTAANHGRLRSGAEDAVNQWLSLLAGVVAVAATVATARRLGVDNGWANVAGAAVAFGTGLFHYATYDSSFAHVYDAALLSLLLLVGAKYTRAAPTAAAAERRTSPTTSWPLGLLVFFLVETRLPLLLVLGGVALTWLLTEARARGIGATISCHRTVIAAGAAGAGLALALQLAYNRYVFGYFTISSYANEHLSWHEHHQVAVFLSFHKGLITWYPVVLVAVVLSLVARRRDAVILWVATTVPLVLLYGAWYPWDLGGGFGHRGFVDLAPVYGIVLAVSLQRSTVPLRFAGALAALVATLMTVGLLRAYWSARISFYGATYGQWEHFGWGPGSIFASAVRLIAR